MLTYLRYALLLYIAQAVAQSTQVSAAATQNSVGDGKTSLKAPSTGRKSQTDLFCSKFTATCFDVCLTGKRAGHIAVKYKCGRRTAAASTLGSFDFRCSCPKDVTNMVLRRIGAGTTSISTLFKPVTVTLGTATLSTPSLVTQFTTTAAEAVETASRTTSLTKYATVVSEATAIESSLTTTTSTSTIVESTTTTTTPPISYQDVTTTIEITETIVLPTTLTLSVAVETSRVPYTSTKTVTSTSYSISPAPTTLPMGVAIIDESNSNSRRGLLPNSKSAFCTAYSTACFRQCKRVKSTVAIQVCRRKASLSRARQQYLFACRCKNGYFETQHALQDAGNDVHVSVVTSLSTTTLESYTTAITVPQYMTTLQTVTVFPTTRTVEPEQTESVFLTTVTSARTTTVSTSTPQSTITIPALAHSTDVSVITELSTQDVSHTVYSSSTTYTTTVVPTTFTSTTTFSEAIATATVYETTVNVLAPTGKIQVLKESNSASMGYMGPASVPAGYSFYPFVGYNFAKASVPAYMLTTPDPNSGRYSLQRADGSSLKQVAEVFNQNPVGNTATKRATFGNNANVAWLMDVSSGQEGTNLPQDIGQYYNYPFETYFWVAKVVDGRIQVRPQWTNPDGADAATVLMTRPQGTLKELCIGGSSPKVNTYFGLQGAQKAENVYYSFDFS